MIEVEKGRLAELLRDLAVNEGVFPSILEGVRFIRVSNSHPRIQVVYEPSIIIVGQGRKIGYLGNQVYHYDAYNYLVLSVPLPFECETVATPEKPLLAVSVGVDPVVLGELLVEMDENPSIRGALPRGIYSTPLTNELISAVTRLLECLKSPRDCSILGPQVVREITYRVLCGEQGGDLRAVAVRHSRFSQIARVLKRIHFEYPHSLDVETMAEEAAMSVSAFHQSFKAVTSTSPLQYLKSIRLHKARMLMLQDGLNAYSAAERVGYESASQFSREFKRMFGCTPAGDTAKTKANT